MRKAPRGLVLDWIDYGSARLAVESWHYSRRMPAGKLAKIGIWEDGRFIGAIIFGMGATPQLVRPYGLSQHQGCELVRIAMRAHRHHVSKSVAIAIRMLKRKYRGLRLVVSFADPAEGHRGGIYQAGNWIYDGETAGDRFPILDGRVVHPRTISERKANGWKIDRKLLKYVIKPGKHRYLMPLDDDMRAQLQSRAKPYPKRGRSIGGRCTSPEEEGGSNPTRPLQAFKEENDNGGETAPR